MKEIPPRSAPCREVIVAKLEGLVGKFLLSSGPLVDELVSPNGVPKFNLLEETFPGQAYDEFVSWLENYGIPWSNKTKEAQGKGPQGTFGRNSSKRKRGPGRYSS